MKNDDIQLIQRVLAGNDDAFSVLVRKYQRQVHALAWRKIGDFHIAEEITQDTFLKAYKKLATLKKPQRFASWLYVIAANRCSSWLRKKRLWTQPLEQLEETEIEQQQKATYSRYVIEENERTAAAAQRDVVKKLLAKLQESERTVITLHYFGEMSCTEIGVFLGVSANTIKSRLRRAQQRLRKEEPMIREALDNFQITPNLTENVMREVARIKPLTPSNGNQPIMPWAIAASTIAVVLLMLGIGNHQYLGRFQEPYSFDATSEMTIELIEAPIVLNLASKTDKRTQLGNPDAPNKNRTPERKSNDIPVLYAEAQTDRTVKDYAKWELPKAAEARLGKGGINVIQFSPDGTQLAVGGNIGVWLYDVETGKEISLFAGMCQSLAFSPDGRYLASNSGGRYTTDEIQVWDTTTGHKVSLVDAPTSAAAVQFSSDSKRLMSVSRLHLQKTISRLNIETGKVDVTTLKAGSRIISGVYAFTDDKIAIGGWDGKIQIWDIRTGKKVFTLGGHADLPTQPFPSRLPSPPLQYQKQILALAFSPDGAMLASGGKDNTVRLWNNASDSEPIVLQKHTGWTNVLAFSPDRKILASGSTDKTVQLWDTTTGAPIATLTGHLNGINALGFSPDGTTLASGSTDGTIRFWNIETRDALATPITGHTEWVKGVTLLNDSATLASVAFNGAITFWDVKASQKITHQIAGHRDWLATLALSPDGTQLASIGADSTMVVGFGRVTKPDSLIRLTDVSTGHEVATLKDKPGVSNLVFSPDGKTVAFSNHGEIRLWNTETETVLKTSPSDPKSNLPERLEPEISALVFSPDGKKLISGTMDGNIQMWDTETGIALVSFTEQDPDDVKYGVKAAVGANPNATIVKTVFPDATVVYQEPITVLTFSPNGKVFAAGSRKQIRLWNMETGNWEKGITSIGGSKEDQEVFHGSEALVFSPDNKTLVNGDGNGKLQLWDITTGNEIITLKGHTKQVETLRFSPDGKTLVSAAQDGTILLWDWDEAIKSSSERNK